MLKRLVAAEALDVVMLKQAVNPQFLSPSKRRHMVLHVHEKLGVLEYRACHVLSQPRSTQWPR